jgi:hypothetical protein
MPWPAPVTIAILPFRRSGMVSPINHGTVRQRRSTSVLDLRPVGMARCNRFVNFDT